MTRVPRVTKDGCPHHIIQRSNNRQGCFFAEQDYKTYLDKLKGSAVRHDVTIHTFILMTNRVHLLMTAPSAGGITQVMQNLGRYYGKYIN